MRPIIQTRLSIQGDSNSPPGNCWAAAIASLLDLSLEEVPDELEFWKPGMKPIESWRPYSKMMHRWLYGLGFILVQCKPGALEYEGPRDCWDGYCLIFGPSPRTGLHAVLGNLKGEIVHDPHPSGAGLKGDPEKDWRFELLIRHFNE